MIEILSVTGACIIILFLCLLFVHLRDERKIVFIPRLESEEDIKEFLEEYLLSTNGLSMAESRIVFSEIKRLWLEREGPSSMKRLHYRLYTGGGEWFDLDECNAIQKSIQRLFYAGFPPNRFKKLLNRCIDEKTNKGDRHS